MSDGRQGAAANPGLARRPWFWSAGTRPRFGRWAGSPAQQRRARSGAVREARCRGGGDKSPAKSETKASHSKAVTAVNRLLLLTTNSAPGWDQQLHRFRGNVALSDGSVQTTSTSLLRTRVTNAGADNLLAFP